MSRARSGTIPVTLALLGLVGLLGLLVIPTVLLGPDAAEDPCVPPGAKVMTAAVGSTRLTSRQRNNAEMVIAVGRRMRLPDQAIVVALATASQESHFTNYANDGAGGDLLFSQAGIARSLRLPHEAVGSDHGSLGIFQQQWPWWGSMAELMDPARTAQRFYRALLQVPGWERMPVTVAAQRVQRSAYPAAYADDEALARQLLAASLQTAEPAIVQADAGSRCSDVTSGPVSFPLPSSSGYRDLRNWGAHASVWSRRHTGTDLSVACGTPVLAATAGTVQIRTDQAWSGHWLVQVSTGEGRLTTWYAHMRNLFVYQGKTVRAGEAIGEVGDLGNATGCHLHFEVHPRGGSIYEDNVDPSFWLATHAGAPVGDDDTDDEITIATFNVLGASHTAPGGKRSELASGVERMRGVVALLDKHGVDVVGLQELQRSQYDELVRLAGNRYDSYHPTGDTENTIVWRRDRWRLVAGAHVAMPYFDGHERQMPIVTLASPRGGARFRLLNVHNPADTRQHPHQERWRGIANSVEVEAVRALKLGDASPVYVTGDLNDRDRSPCRLVREARLNSPTPACGNGTTARGIDWTFASDGRSAVASVLDRNPLSNGVSDHPMRITTWRAGNAG